MEALIRAAALAGERHALRPPAAPAAADAAPRSAVPDLQAECERLRAQLDAQRREFETGLAQRDATLAEERAQLAQAAAEREQRAFAEAAEQGRAEGFEQGRAEGEAQLREQGERLAALASGLAGLRAAALEEAEDGMVELVYGAVCRMLGSDASLRTAVAAAVAECRACADREAVLTVAVHKDDLALLAACGAEVQGLRWIADAGVELGGCMVAGSSGTLDARLETQLAQLRTTLLEVRAARAARGAPA
jgi:flagellar assembly protein FliH